MNKLTRAFIDECKQDKRLKEIYKERFIEFDNYFKYSGKIEESKPQIEWKKYRENIKLSTDDPIVNFYFNNPGYTLDEIGVVFKIHGGTVSSKIETYLKNKIK